VAPGFEATLALAFEATLALVDASTGPALEALPPGVDTTPSGSQAGAAAAAVIAATASTTGPNRLVLLRFIMIVSV
jgi:hypothetical protein